jgi:hypothetical protein
MFLERQDLNLRVKRPERSGPQKPQYNEDNALAVERQQSRSPKKMLSSPHDCYLRCGLLAVIRPFIHA